MESTKKENNDGLSIQNLEALDISTLTPLTQEVISRQATINIGTIGHVAHGKSTVVKSLSGVHTVKFKSELERNITIKLGYANAKIYKLNTSKKVLEEKEIDEEKNEVQPEETPGSYTSHGSAHPNKYTDEKGDWELVRHVSFVDCPGHDILMATMLNGAAVMDAALLLIAGNESCPQPQTSEHLAAVEIMKLQHILILQNKIDLVKREEARKQFDEIKAFVSGTVAEQAPIIPISAVLKYNVDVICEYLCTKIPIPLRDFTSDAQMIVIRSFDVNKPGEEVSKLKGGVAGGSILKGVLRLGQTVEIRPGAISKGSGSSRKCTPLITTIVSLKAEHNQLQYAVPGGLIGVGTKVDPTLTRGDRLIGQVLGAKGSLPPVYIEIEVSFYLLKRLLGVKSSSEKTKKVDSRTKGKKGKSKVSKLSKGEVLLLNIGSTSTGGKVLAMKEDMARLSLTTPVCTEEGEKIALSRRVDKHWRLIGWGVIRKGQKLPLDKA
eukprot:augustus_masked-scaffold_61-processed-gene-0.2-mRNA-1 protein AED:0.02 eAED:0.02 QI:0/-1/0/1/-1/1/1/0/492